MQLSESGPTRVRSAASIQASPWLMLLAFGLVYLALAELACFQEEYETKYPKAVTCLTKDRDTLFTFMDYPASHWIHLRTTNAIESAFSTVKARTRTTKGAGSRYAGLAMAFKLLIMAEKR